MQRSSALEFRICFKIVKLILLASLLVSADVGYICLQTRILEWLQLYKERNYKPRAVLEKPLQSFFAIFKDLGYSYCPTYTLLSWPGTTFDYM